MAFGTTDRLRRLKRPFPLLCSPDNFPGTGLLIFSSVPPSELETTDLVVIKTKHQYAGKTEQRMY